MQELLRLRDAGQLNEIQAQWFRAQKAPEELFDTENDPHELKNLAMDPHFQGKLAELRAEMDIWLNEIDDKGFIPEVELIEEFWPGGIQPITLDPVVSHRNGMVHVSSATLGANIAYQLLTDEQELGNSWRLYSEPLRLSQNQQLFTVAHRIGYAPSEVVSYQED